MDMMSNTKLSISPIIEIEVAGRYTARTLRTAILMRCADPVNPPTTINRLSIFYPTKIEYRFIGLYIKKLLMRHQKHYYICLFNGVIHFGESFRFSIA